MTAPHLITAGLELARKLLNDDRAAFVQCHIVPEAGLSADDQAVADDYTAAIAAITGAAAELQRMIAERNALAARLAEIEAQEPAEHLYAGDCPDSCQPDARDPACPACCAMVAASQPPAAEPVQADESPRPADPRTPPPGCRLLGDYEPAQAGDMAYIGSIGGRWRPVRPRMGIIGATMDELSDSARVLALARHCRCGPGGCADRVSCPRGER